MGPLPLSELREWLRKERGSTNNATVVIHARMGDQFMPLHLYEELRIATLPPECAVVCPHCETLQPRCAPGECKCVRCGAKLVIGGNYKAELGANPNRPWQYVGIAGVIGLIVFGVVVPNNMGLWLSWTLGFGAPWIAMIRQGVGFSKGYKFTARKNPWLYGFSVVALGVATILGLLLVVLEMVSM